MNDIRALLKTAARRLEANAFIAALHVVAVALGAVLLVLALADRAPGESFVAWAWVAPALVALALLVAVTLWTKRRLSPLQVAVAVDDRLDLREKLSTALHCHARDDAFAQAAVGDAVATARDPRSRESVRRLFPIAAPSRWWIAPLLVLAAAGVLMLPQGNLFAREPEVDPDALAAAENQVDKSLEAVVKTIEENPQLNAELAGLVDELTNDGRPADAPKRPEEVRRDALKKVTELNKRLDDILSGEKGKTAKAVDEMLSKLETPDAGPAKALAEALAKGDFRSAKKALEQLAEEAGGGQMTEEQKQQLAQQLANLGQQLDQLAGQQQQLEQALQQAGLNPQLVNNPQALQQALQQAQNLNEQQLQQLQQMIQAQQQAQQMCQGLGGACQQMAQGLQGAQAGQMGQMGQGGAMMNQLNELEQLQMLLQQAQAAANQCAGQRQGLGQGLTLQGGMGRRGQGAGGKAPLLPTPTGTVMTKADAPIVDGEIIASMLIDGVPIKGESKARLKTIVDAEATGYDEAVEEVQLPRRYHEPHKHYFGELQKQVDVIVAGSETKDEDGDAGSGDGDQEAGEGEGDDGR